jgi:PAS domain S-box-containing protein
MDSRKAEQLESLLDHAEDFIGRLDRNKRHLYVNQALCDAVGIPREEYIGKTIEELGFPKELSGKWNKAVDEVFRTGKTVRIEFPFPGPGGERYLQSSIVPETLIDGSIESVAAVSRDITEKKLAERDLVRALEIKETLMQEMNHRIKNNLALISSLLRLKGSTPGIGSDLADVQRQIDAIRFVHEGLYQSGTITQIRVSEYIRKLLSTVFSSFSGSRVDIEYDIKDVSLPTKTAVPLGLLINEVAVNALKHAFSPREPARFSVAMREGKGEYVVNLANSGAPFPGEVDLDEPKTLGLRLITALVKQLGGTLELEREPSPKYTITFPKPPGPPVPPEGESPGSGASVTG